MRWLAVARVVPLVLYPFAVYLVLGRVDARYLGVVLVGLMLMRYRNRLSSVTDGLRPAIVVFVVALLLYAAAVWWTNNEHVLRLYPALFNVGMLGIFGWTLHRRPTMVERFARMQQGELPMKGVRYTAVVTQVWCLFFLLNGVVAAYTAFWTSRAMWTIYNGLIAYFFMGALFLGEWLVRRHVLRKATVS